MPDQLPQPHRRRTRWLIGTLVAVTLLLILAQLFLATLIKHKLISTIQTRTNATLHVGSVTYLPPYGVRVDNAEFSVPDNASGSLQLIKIKRLELKLARLPLHPGPLLIQRISIDTPQIHLIQTADGLLGIHNLIKSTDENNQLTRKKLSEIFELRHLSISHGQITYEDRTEPQSLPTVWKNLSINTETRPSSAAVYSYDFQGAQAPLASIKSAGTFDIDNLILDAKSLSLTVHATPDTTESSVPAPLQKLLAQYQIQGRLAIAGHGRVPLKQLDQADYRFDVTLDQAKGRLPDYDRPLDNLFVRIRVTGQASHAISTLVALEAVSGPDVLHVDNGDIAIDLNQNHWNLQRLDLRLDASAVGVRPFDVPASAPLKQKQLRAGGRLELTAAGDGPIRSPSPRDFMNNLKFQVVATASDFHIQPPGLKAPLQLLTGVPIVANQDVLRISNLTARYGEDLFQITTLRIPLKDLPRILRVEQLSLSATFDRHTPPYPGIAGKWLRKINPEGPFELGGTVSYDQDGSPKLNYHLLLHSDRGAIEYSDGTCKIPVTRIHADALIDPGTARLDYLEANIFGGLLAGAGSTTTTDPFQWKAKGSLHDFDLRTSIQQLTGKQFDTSKLAGQAFLNVDLTGGLTLESIKGSGHARLINGSMFEIPVLTDILGHAGLGKGMVASQAAATFDIADSKLNLHQAALGSPAIGVQGHGIIGFDKSLNLDVVVAPLGEWKDRLKKTGIPFLSRALGEVAGAVQSAINTASTLLYEFHVSGTATSPKITPVPTPLLTKNGAAIFSTMLGLKDTSLDQEITRQDSNPSP